MLLYIANIYKIIFLCTIFFCDIVFDACAMEKKIEILNKELFSLVKRDCAVLIPYVIKQGADINRFELYEREEGGKVFITPLIWAAASGNTESLKVLLQHGASPNLTSSFKRSALMEAAGHRNTLCMELLIKYKANPFYVTPRTKNSALRDAVRSGHDTCVKLLFAHIIALDKQLHTIFLEKNLRGYFECLPENEYKKLVRQKIELFLMLKKHKGSILFPVPKPVLLDLILKKSIEQYFPQFNELYAPLYEEEIDQAAMERFSIKYDIQQYINKEINKTSISNKPYVKQRKPKKTKACKAACTIF